jgi:hypothetical protein
LTKFRPLLCLALAAVAYAGPRAATLPYHFHNDFEDESLSQWASYPPPQDVGYEPSLSPVLAGGAHGRVLVRTVQPVSTAPLRFGFVKKLDAIAEGPVEVSFDYRLDPASPGTLFEVGIAGSNGKAYRTQIRAAAFGAWSRANVRLAGIPQGTKLEAVYLIGRVEHPDLQIHYRFSLDNVSLQASAETHFAVQVPKSTLISPFTAAVAETSYAPGETIAIEAASPVPLSEASCVLRNSDGQIVKTVPLARQRDMWTNPSVHTISASDDFGIWHAKLLGTTPTGLVVSTDVRLWVRPSRIDVHPSLYFGAQDRAVLLERSRSSLRAAALSSRGGASLGQGASLFPLLDARYLLPSLPLYFDFVTRAEHRILYNSLLYFVDGDQEARESAKSALLAVAAWPNWAPPWFAAHGQYTYYPVGELTASVALGYDVLYDRLSEQERHQIRRALLEFGIKNAYKEYVLDNRIMADTSNWIGHAVGGAILACLALNDKADDAEINTYFGGLLLKFENHLAASYLPDGSYGEGVSYQEFDLKTTGPALSALKRAGIDEWRRLFVKDSLAYPTYLTTDPPHDGMDFGDTHAATGYSAAPAVQHSDDPAAHWFYNRFKHESFADFLFPPDSRAPASPPPSASRIFRDKGNAVFRTGWGADDAVLLFRAGPTFNHNHADQGEFLLRAFGENLAVEAGYSDYYKDPYYRTYFSQAEGHNTLLVDGDTASQEIADTPQFKALDRYPRIKHAITSDSYDALESELAPVYRDRLKTYTRRIVFLKPSYVVIYDDAVSRATPRAFDWLLHLSNKRVLEMQPESALYSTPKATMGIQVLEPAHASLATRIGHPPFALLSTAASGVLPPVPAILDVRPAAPALEQKFIVVLSLARKKEEAAGLMSQVKEISGSACTGVQIGEQKLFFSSAPVSSYGDWTTDARVWSFSSTIVTGEDTTVVRDGKKAIWQSDVAASFVAKYSSQEIELTVSSERSVKIHFYPGFELSAAAGIHTFKLAYPQPAAAAHPARVSIPPR